MSVIENLRQAVALELGAVMGVTVHPSWPASFQPPCAFVAPPLGGDYVRAGPNFREHTVALDLLVLVDHADGDTALGALEALIELAVIHTEADWLLMGIDPPGPLPVVSEGGADYLTCVIHLAKPVRF